MKKINLSFTKQVSSDTMLLPTKKVNMKNNRDEIAKALKEAIKGNSKNPALQLFP